MKVIVRKVTQYGVDYYYPVNEMAESFRKFRNHKTLLARDLALIKHLGFEVELKAEELPV